MEQIIKDVRYGLRGLLKRPGFTAVAVITLALGIGANAAIFSVVNAVLLRPLQFKDPERLVILWEDATFAGFPRNTPAPANYVDWKNQTQSYADMAATHESSLNLTGDGEPQRVATREVTANFFSVLGVQPLIGRGFLSDEEGPQASRVVVLSYPLWQGRYGGSSDILNRTILLDGEKHTVVGVMPSGFQWIDTQDELWVPFRLTAEDWANRGGHYLTVVARLKPGVTVDQAQSDLNTVMARIVKDHPRETMEGKLGAFVMPLHEQLAGDARRPLLVLLVAVAFVLLIACANIASLLLARAAGRRREIAVRMALGASRSRIVRQLLTESLLLSIIGGIAGLVLAFWSFGFFESLIPEGMKQSTALKLDAWVLLVSFAVSIVTGIVFGLIPAMQSARVDLNESLKQSGGRSGAGAGSRLRSGMIVFEVSLSLVLLVGAVLLIQTLFQLFNQYSVLSPEKVLTVRTVLPPARYEDPQKRIAFYENVLQHVKSTPGVASAGYTTSVPLAWKGGTSAFYPEGMKDPIPGLALRRESSAGERGLFADDGYSVAPGPLLRRTRQRARDAGGDHQRDDGARVLAQPRSDWPPFQTRRSDRRHAVDHDRRHRGRHPADGDRRSRQSRNVSAISTDCRLRLVPPARSRDPYGRRSGEAGWRSASGSSCGRSGSTDLEHRHDGRGVGP